MDYEVIVEGFVLQVEVTHCINEPARSGTWDSDWDAQGCRDLEFVVVSGAAYDDDGIRMDVSPYDCYVVAEQYAKQIEAALWFEIGSRRRRERRVA
ncbi:hypothetical protein Q7O56_20230 [Pseudomonas protegens]|uniref:hypothetical protein n=1 Tax=Pseudomonas protegens TaxID=380021 RepID=UPI002767E3C6|nr:hypothetical protein [Pseudomonas protegens]MDP9511369.1 hypothetical protein [Pseudomonas protegens]